MQKIILKQQYENFAASRSEGLDKTYDRFQKLISQLEIHGEVISQEDENLKLLRSLPSDRNNIALIMRNKSDLDTLSMDDLYNNMKVTNEVVNTADEVSTASSQGQASSLTYADDAEEGITNFALMAYTSQGSSSSSSSNSEVHTCSKDCYQMGLESLEARIVVHEKNESVYEEDIAFLKYNVQVKDISIKDLKNHYDSQMNESEVVHSVFNNRESDVDNSLVNDRFKTDEGFHTVPPPYTGNYMPSRPDLSFAGLDDSVYKTKVSETETSISNTSKDIVEKSKTVRPSAPIIED
ncbi:hypothetical protein Tco_0844307 [Tanacetum coccineum]